jgi:hypothetical protein
MAKNTGRDIPPAGDSGSGARGADDERSTPLPRPSVSVPEGGEDPAEFGEAGIRGVVMNPIYTGIGQYPKYIADDQWIAAARRILAEDGPDQFLVNLLYVLRRSFGCVEWDGNLPPDRN